MERSCGRRHPVQKWGGSGKKYWPSLPPRPPDGVSLWPTQLEARGQGSSLPGSRRLVNGSGAGEWIWKEAKGAYSEWRRKVLLHGKCIGSCLPYSECSIKCCLYNHRKSYLCMGAPQGQRLYLFYCLAPTLTHIWCPVVSLHPSFHRLLSCHRQGP